MKSDSIQKNPKVTVIVVLIFAIIVFLFSNCRTTEFKIHSLKLERREAEYLYFRLISDIDLLDKRECQGEHCYVRFEFYPIDKYNPQRRVKIGGWPEKLKIYPWNESGVKEQFDKALRQSGPTFSIYTSYDRATEEEEDLSFVGSRSDGTFEYHLKIPMMEKYHIGHCSWKDPDLNDEEVEEILRVEGRGNLYILGKSGGTYVFSGPTV
ncbi:hypothetical protein LEP1GSC043_4021 [Leptospira weilii str. Ecochallenge]|uniref:Uncharacterized protein n=1 Tax=Leptospira weilii str. Ecochallenge TaxID=1049986 RepID=N1U7U5_9LEPT|nr:hypothetical protein LEP1GSC043_4021 [Leptospira weilii str. Ecochallenge]